MPVEYEIKVEAEQEDYHGNVSAIDDATDRENEQWVTDELNRGNDLAWCSVLVYAKIDGFEGWDSLGGVSCRNQADLDEVIESHDMRGEALADLKRRLGNTEGECKARMLAARKALKALEKEEG